MASDARMVLKEGIPRLVFCVEVRVLEIPDDEMQ